MKAEKLRDEIANTVCKDSGHRYERLTTAIEELNGVEITMFCHRCGDTMKINLK